MLRPFNHQVARGLAVNKFCPPHFQDIKSRQCLNQMVTGELDMTVAMDSQQRQAFCYLSDVAIYKLMPNSSQRTIHLIQTFFFFLIQIIQKAPGEIPVCFQDNLNTISPSCNFIASETILYYILQGNRLCQKIK